MNIAMLLQMAADACPDRRALTSAHEHLTYGELYRAACAAADLIRSSSCRYVSVLESAVPRFPSH
jgi:acyl-CoA synthetase (AMP-forming)/AMP-acid ligase II